MKIYNSIAELTGNTPLIEVHHLEEKFHLQAHLLVKTESFNPAGSVKDRIARRMIEDAEKEGILKKGTTIIEPTSGNTGIGLSMVATVKGYRIIIVMPSTMSPERVKLMKAYGAEVVLSDGAKGMKGAIAKADELHAEIKDSWIPGQFVNPSNWKAHYDTTGPEIWKDTDGTVDIFIAGIGTGGTITGTGKYLKEKKPSVKVVAVEPSASAVLNGKPAGPHKIQGIGAGFIPDVLDTSIDDEIQDVEASLPELHYMPGLKKRRNRRIRARPSWCFCLIPETAISPQPCSRTEQNCFFLTHLHQYMIRKLAESRAFCISQDGPA